VTFGPLAVRSFVKKVNKKVRRKALAMVLSDKLSSDHFIAVDDLKIDEAKTSTLIALRKALPGSDAKALIITTKEQTNLVNAAKNLPRTATISAGSLNVRDLLKYPYVIASAEAVAIMKESYLD